MISPKIFALVGIAAVVKFTSATPDSAGIVEMTNGLAYGGIPYGSVTGMVAKFVRNARGQPVTYQSKVIVPNAQKIVITPNVRAAGLVARERGPVQIYNHASVIAPGVIGTISEIGY
ncbi:uncharacterized protein LOC107270890 [Cephus cinctus]|uniref:Uncharacterized protein LOC107270890 n=1 Tax=Cephus cinctus TaxID=211228 RepID=A0AAJ7C4J3_CEPCN|nr:uncharacterized protein LOC107270890 [Cephus cinctus]